MILSSVYAQRDTVLNPVTPTSGLTPEELAEPLIATELTVNIQYVTTEKSLTITVQNYHNSSIEFGARYDFFKLKNGEWKPFPTDPIWILPLYGISPGGNFHQVANITGFISGRYRVTKEIQIGNAKKISAAEFIVERPQINPNGKPEYGYALKLLSLSERSLYSVPELTLYNQGGLTLTLPSEYHFYQRVNGEWVETAGNPGGGPSSVVAPGKNYVEYLDIDLKDHSFRYVRPVLVEGYNKPVQFVYEVIWP